MTEISFSCGRAGGMVCVLVFFTLFLFAFAGRFCSVREIQWHGCRWAVAGGGDTGILVQRLESQGAGERTL